MLVDRLLLAACAHCLLLLVVVALWLHFGFALALLSMALAGATCFLVGMALAGAICFLVDKALAGSHLLSSWYGSCWCHFHRLQRSLNCRDVTQFH